MIGLDTYQSDSGTNPNGGGGAVVVLISCLIMLVTAGCAHDNGIIIKPAAKSTTAENIEAGGRVAAGAWDRVGRIWRNH